MKSWNDFGECEKLKTRIANAAETHDRTVVISILTDIQQVMASTTELTARNLLNTLLFQLNSSFFGLLTANEFRKLVTETFLMAPPACSLLVALNNVKYAGKFTNLNRFFELLDAVEECAIEKITLKSFDKRPDDPEWCTFVDEIGRLLWQLQDRVYNMTANSKSRTFTTSGKDDVHLVFLANHWKRILKTVKNGILTAKERIESSTDTNMQFIAALIPHLFRGSPQTFDELIKWLGSGEHHAQSAIWERLNCRLLSEAIMDGFLPGRSAILQIVLAVPDGKMLKRVLSDEVRHDPFKKYLFEEMLVNKVFSPEQNVPIKLVQCINVFIEEHTSTEARKVWVNLYIETAIRLLKVWSQKSHLLHSSDEQLTYIECALVCFVKYAKDEVRKGMKWLAEEWLLNGTQYHLKSSDTRRKIRGLFITEKLTEWLSFGHDLKFDITPEMGQELVDLRAIVDEDQLEVLSKSAEASNETMKNNSLNSEKNENSLEKLSRNLEKLSTKGAPPSQLDSDDDDDFPSYQIPEQELNLSEKKQSGDDDEETFEKPEPAPYYIRDCMDALGTNENCAKFEAAFGVLNQFIRKRALGYDDIAEELITKMVFLEDRFSTVKFEERKFEIIVSCLVMSPHLAPMLIDLMYSRRSPMCYRYLILNCLAESATQLSTLDNASAKVTDLSTDISNRRQQQRQSKTHDIPEISNETAPSSDWRGVIEERLEKKTRRFTSQKASSSTSTPQKNRFGEHAVGFLRPLLAINQYREHLDLRKEDSSLLAKILTTAAHLMQCARNCLSAPRLAMWLEVCVRELISHEDASVRLAVLLCYDAICRALPDDVFFTLFTGSVNEWLAYTVYVIENDPSGMCREMAATLQYTICSKAPQNSI